MHFGAQLRGLRAPCERFAPWVTPGPRITRFRLAADLGRMGLDTHRVSNKVSKITSRHLVPLDRAFPAHTLRHAPRGGSWISCGSRAPCTAPCVSGTIPRSCGPVGSGRPCFLRTAGSPGARGDAEKQSSIEDSSRRPRARSKRPSCSTGGRGTTCCTKDTRPSRATHTHTVRPPSVSPSGGLCVSSIFLSARAALGVLGHARSDAEFLGTFRDSFVRLFTPLRPA